MSVFDVPTRRLGLRVKARKRFCAKGLKEGRSRLPRSSGIASGEPIGRKSGGWDETDCVVVRGDAPVQVPRQYVLHIDLVYRTAGYVSRIADGKGGEGRGHSPIPMGLHRSMIGHCSIARAKQHMRISNRRPAERVSNV